MRVTNWKWPTNRQRVNWLSRHIRIPPGRAVDIGTKDGSAVRALLDAGWKAVGYDPDTRFHAFARETYGIEIQPGWFTAERVGRGSLDLVTAYHVLEHVTEPLPWLSEIRDALQPEGYLHIETPNLRLIEARQLNIGHVVLYTSHTLRGVLEAAGFRVVTISEFQPGGNRSYDLLGAIVQRAAEKQVRFAFTPVDRAAHRYVTRPTPDPLTSPQFRVRLYRRLKRRARVTYRRARFNFE